MMRESLATFVLFLVTLNVASETAEIRYDNWMGDLNETIRKNLPINYLSIPGSNHAGTYELDDRVGNDIVTSNTWNHVINTLKLIGKVLPTSILGNIVYSEVKDAWARRQKHRISEQLAMGSRFFDIHLSHPDGALDTDIRIVHGAYGPLFTELLVDMRDFLDAHPKEVILVSIYKLYNMDGSMGELDSILESHFGSKLLRKSHNPKQDQPFSFRRFTLDSLAAAGVQVILLGDFGDKMQKVDVFNEMETIWTNSYDVDEVMDYQKTALESRPTESSSFLVSDYILTENEMTMVNVILTSIIKSIGPLEWLIDKVWSDFKKTYPLEEATRSLKYLFVWMEIVDRTWHVDQWKKNNVILIDLFQSPSTPDEAAEPWFAFDRHIIWVNNNKNLTELLVDN